MAECFADGAGDADYGIGVSELVGRRSGPDKAGSSTSAIAGGRCGSALALQQVADRGHDFGHDAEMAEVIEDD